MFYEEGIKYACVQLGFDKTSASLSHLLKQLRTSYQGSPVARTEIQRMLGGGALGAVGGGVAGGSMGDDGVSVGGAGLGALLGAAGGALGAGGLGRLQEGRITKALKARKDIPFSERSALKNEAMEQLIPRMPKRSPTPRTAKAPKAPEAPPNTGGVTIPAGVGGPEGMTNIPPELLAQARAAGML